MREIKFRCWDNKGKVMWHPRTIPEAIYATYTDKWEDETIDLLHNGLIYLQHTGLKDKNGKEIYEGDIVRVYDLNRGCDGCADGGNEDGRHEGTDCENYICTQKIEWSEWGGYYCDDDTGDGCMTLGNDFFELEVIGSIYENPELLSNK